jgi:hypothetical protein
MHRLRDAAHKGFVGKSFHVEKRHVKCGDVRAQRRKMGDMLFRSTALSRNTKIVIPAEKSTP